MKLAYAVESLDAVPEPLRAAYTEKDGKFVLAVDGLEDTSGLKSALEKEREARKGLEAQTKRWAGLGKTPDEIAELVKAQQDAETERRRKEGDFDALLKQHQDTWSKREKELTERMTAAEKAEDRWFRESQLVQGLAKAGATPEGLDLLPDRLALRIRTETVDGQRVRHVLQADGETPMAGKGKGGVATIDDLIQEVVKQYPGLFKATGGAGGGKPPGSAGGTGARTMTRAEFDALPPKERAARMAAGTSLTD